MIYRQNGGVTGGVIERVSDFYVFVRYDEGNHDHPIATDAERIELEDARG